jgi:cytochrome c-type biogenesis protein CcmH
MPAFALAFSTPAAPAAAQAQGSNTGATVIAEESRIDRLVREVGSDLRCVVCQGLSVQDSPSELAQEMRVVIREKLEEGMTPDEVKQYFVGRYGEYILLAPEAKGFNLAVYLLPVAVVVGGAVFLVFAMRRWARRTAATADVTADSPAEVDPELLPWE